MTTLEQQPIRPPHRAHRTPRRTPDSAGLRAAQLSTPTSCCSRCRAFAPFGSHLWCQGEPRSARPFRSSRRRVSAQYACEARTSRAVRAPRPRASTFHLSLATLTPQEVAPSHNGPRAGAGCTCVVWCTLSNHCVLSLAPLAAPLSPSRLAPSLPSLLDALETTAHPPHDASRRCWVHQRGAHVRRKCSPGSPPFLSARPRHRPETTRHEGFGARSAAQDRR